MIFSLGGSLRDWDLDFRGGVDEDRQIWLCVYTHVLLLGVGNTGDTGCDKYTRGTSRYRVYFYRGGKIVKSDGWRAVRVCRSEFFWGERE